MTITLFPATSFAVPMTVLSGAHAEAGPSITAPGAWRGSDAGAHVQRLRSVLAAQAAIGTDGAAAKRGIGTSGSPPRPELALG